MEGWLHKQGERGPVKGYKRRWFKQEASILYYSKTKTDVSLGKIDLETSLSCSDVTETKDCKFRFRVSLFVSADGIF